MTRLKDYADALRWRSSPLRRSGSYAPILDAAIEAAHTRFRPILMTSFAFLLGVLPLVTATGAGANARQSLGVSTFSGMVASTCLAVLFVPSFFVVMQRLEERRRTKRIEAAVVAASPPSAHDTGAAGSN